MDKDEQGRQATHLIGGFSAPQVQHQSDSHNEQKLYRKLGFELIWMNQLQKWHKQKVLMISKIQHCFFIHSDTPKIRLSGAEYPPNQDLLPCSLKGLCWRRPCNSCGWIQATGMREAKSTRSSHWWFVKICPPRIVLLHALVMACPFESWYMIGQQVWEKDQT